MHVINLLPHAQHYSYASTGDGGRTLAAGEHSPELPLTVIHHPQFQKDLESNKIQLRLSKDDTRFLSQLTRLNKEPAKKVKQAVQKKVAKPKQKKVVKKGELKPQVTKLPPGQPNLGQQPEVIDEKKAGQVDLAALKGHNRLAQSKKEQTPTKMQEIKQFMGGNV